MSHLLIIKLIVQQVQDLIGQLRDFDPRFVTSSVDVAFAAGNQLLPHMLEKSWAALRGEAHPAAQPRRASRVAQRGRASVRTTFSPSSSQPDESTLHSDAGWSLPPPATDTRARRVTLPAATARPSSASAHS